MDVWAPVVNPTLVSPASPNRSTSHRGADLLDDRYRGARAVDGGVLSHAVTNQSAAAAAGEVPPMT
ncbi:MAG TPA: hypothetical protein VK988_22950 [Acidimicrobiales bacterium]|nr:hypothetical protein [Acidimicrobiales bacterium]